MVLLTPASVAAACSLADEAARASARGLKHRMVAPVTGVVELAASSNSSGEW